LKQIFHLISRGRCACSLLNDDADWNATCWSKGRAGRACAAINLTGFR
jgi:hypothetical protein